MLATPPVLLHANLLSEGTDPALSPRMRGEVILVVDPDNWPTALGAIGFFGLCAGFTTRLLVSRRAAAGRR